MPRKFESMRALRLAGTVSIPTPFPESGWISYGRNFDSQGSVQTMMNLVRVEHVLSNQVMVARTVRRKDLQAIWLADHEENPFPHRRMWVNQPEVFYNLLKKRKLVGSIFVREAAPVLLEVQVGMTAAESAEYYPPIARRAMRSAQGRDCHCDEAIFGYSAAEPRDCHSPIGFDEDVPEGDSDDAT